MESVRDKIEKWLQSAPIEITITEFDIEPQHDIIREAGMYTVSIIKGGYEGYFKFKCLKYEESENVGKKYKTRN